MYKACSNLLYTRERFPPDLRSTLVNKGESLFNFFLSSTLFSSTLDPLLVYHQGCSQFLSERLKKIRRHSTYPSVLRSKTASRAGWSKFPNYSCAFTLTGGIALSCESQPFSHFLFLTKNKTFSDAELVFQTIFHDKARKWLFQ